AGKGPRPFGLLRSGRHTAARTLTIDRAMALRRTPCLTIAAKATRFAWSTASRPQHDRACDHPSAQPRAGLGRGAAADPVVHRLAHHRLLRAEEFQRDVLLRFAGAAGA